MFTYTKHIYVVHTYACMYIWYTQRGFLVVVGAASELRLMQCVYLRLELGANLEEATTLTCKPARYRKNKPVPLLNCESREV